MNWPLKSLLLAKSGREGGRMCTITPWATLSDEQHWYLVLEISTVQNCSRKFHCSRRFEQCWFFLDCWFKGPKIRLAQGKCWKNSVDQIYLKLNGISVDSRTGILDNIFKPTDSFAQGVTVLHIFYCAHEIWTLLM